MVYVDDLRETNESLFKKFPFREHCHMIADTTEELMEMADKIRLKRTWVQGKKVLHFDLNRGKRSEAVYNGAKEVSVNEITMISLNLKIAKKDIEEGLNE